MNIFRMQMFIWNNIFFSVGFNARDYYKDFRGDTAAGQSREDIEM